MAEDVMQAPLPASAPLPITPLLQRSGDGALATAPPEVDAALAAPGRPLDAGTRAFMEERFGHDFSSVRIHTGTRAAESARAVEARAYAVGSDIVFGTREYRPRTAEGQRLLAHELAHTIQQGPTPSGLNSAQRLVQRQCPFGTSCSIGFDIDPHPAHVPACGSQPTAQAPAGVQNVTWSLEDGAVAVAPGTTIDQSGAIAIDAAQQAGSIDVRATAPVPGGGSCFCDQPFRIRSHPTGITSTSVVGPPPNPDRNYGGVFDHVFTSNDGNVASLEGVAVGERFPNVPNPAGSTHANIQTPFGPFTLNTATLTPNASDNWFLTAAGGLNGTQDQVTFARRGLDVGRFIRSTSNPNPANTLPQSFALDQDLHWYCRPAPAANRWTDFVRIQHERGLRQDGDAVEFFTKVNSVERPDAYTGPPAFTEARVKKVEFEAKPVPDPVPSGHALAFSIQGNAHGATIDSATGELTPNANPTPGQPRQIRVRAGDTDATNGNFDETMITL